MKVEILVNGKINAIGVNSECVRVAIVYDGLKKPLKYIYKLYKYSDKSLMQELFSIESNNNQIYLTDYLAIDCLSEYICQVILNYDNEEKIIEQTKFETGLSISQINGQWIENPLFNGQVAEYFKSFNVKRKVIKSRLHIVGLGFYSSKINDKLTDDYFFKPLLSDFDVRENLGNQDYNEKQFANNKKTVYYDTFDVTDLIKTGENCIKILLGTGWYCNLDKTVTDPSYSFNTPKLFFELHLYYEDGKEIIKSDENCLVCNLPVVSQLFNGDIINFAKIKDDMILSRKACPPKAELLPSECSHDKIKEKLLPIEKKIYNDILELDFGKNHTGSLAFKVKGKRGAKLIIKYYETKTDGVLDINTSACGLYDRNLKKFIGSITQKSEYILSGNIDEIYPLFHWNCYRYATIETENKSDFEVFDLKSLFITGDLKIDGEFKSSNDFLNRLYNAFVLTQQDNMHCGVPSDCPHREKLPYTGDGQLCMQSVLNIFDSENFYRKWLKDIIDSQREDGWIPYTAPYIAGGGGCWWSNALPTVAINLYYFTGDKKILCNAYEPLKNLLKYYENSTNSDYIVVKKAISWLLGDWLAPKDTFSNKELINTLAYYYAVEKTRETAEILGDNEYVLGLNGLKEKIANAINLKFFDYDNAVYAKGVQGESILPVLYGIVPNGYRERVLDKIIKHYKENPQFDTGVVLTPVLLDFLTQTGNEKIALEILLRKEYPSLFDMLKGETTLCESFDKINNKYLTDVSRSHPMFGSVICWVIRNVAGLDLSNLYKKEIIFSPKFTNEIRSCKASKQTCYGRVSINYDNSEKLVIELNVPYGLKGVLQLKDYDKTRYEIFELKNGTIKYQTDASGIILDGGDYTVREL